MGSVDRNVILRKVSELDTYLKQISEFSGLSVQDYSNDWKTQRIVERTLQMMIETCVDIANHIISGSDMRTPTTYGDTFRILLENRVLGPEMAAVMEKMTKFRNVVVHQYEMVDAEIVTVILKKHLADFKQFKEAILEYIKT